MGIYDQLLPSNGQYISTYAGAPLEETAALGETLTQNFERGMQGVSAYNVMRSNAEVLGVDEDFKNEIFDKSYEGLKKYAEKGDYENAIPAIMNATTMISGDDRLKSAMQAKKTVGAFKSDLDKRLSDGKIDRWQYDQALNRMSAYQGISSGDSIANHIKIPSAKVDIQQQMEDAAKTVKSQKTVGKRKWISELGKYEQVTTEGYNPEELLDAMTNSLSSPEAQAYLADMREAIGDEAVNQMITDNAMAIGQAYETEKDSVSYIQPAKGRGPGATGGPGSTRAPGTGIKDVEELHVRQEEGEDYIQVGSDLDITKRAVDSEGNLEEQGWLSKFLWGEDRVVELDGKKINLSEDISDLPMETRIRISEQRKKELNESEGVSRKWKEMTTSVANWWDDIPSDEDVEEYGKVSNAAKDFYSVSEEAWSEMSPQERDNMTVDYMDNEGSRRSKLYVSEFNIAEEIESRNIKDPKATSTTISKNISDDIKLHYQSRDFYSLDSEKSIKLEDEEELLKALQGDNDYSFEVIKNSDPRNPYSESNPDLASSYVARVIDKENPDNVKYYLVPKDTGYQGSDNKVMQAYTDPRTGKPRKVSNRDYNNKIAEIYNMFPTAEYRNEYSDGRVVFEGRRDKRDENLVIVKDLKRAGRNVKPETMALIAQQYGGVYDEEANEIYGLQDEVIAQIVLSLNY